MKACKHHQKCNVRAQVKDSTGDDERKGVEVTSTHEEELPGSRGSANLALRWHKDSKMPAHLNVQEIGKEAKTKAKDILRASYTAEDEGKFIGIVGFECRGMEVTDWQPQVSIKLPASAATGRHPTLTLTWPATLSHACTCHLSRIPPQHSCLSHAGILMTGVLFMRKGKGQFNEPLRRPKNVLSCIYCTSAEVTAPELLAPQMLRI